MSTARARRDPALLTVVVPCCNEEAVLAEMHRRLVAALDGIPRVDFEVIYVDDGSQDATLDLLRERQRADARVRVVSLSRNFGQQAAITAGLTAARGDAVAVIDGDLQDPPEVLRSMMDRWRDGVDVAFGVRTDRDGETAVKRWTSSAFYRFLARIADVPIPLDVGDFRLMDRVVVDAVLAMPEQHRFVRGMVAWTGFRQEPVHFRRAARFAGKASWTYWNLVRLAVDGILSFSTVPLRLATGAGFVASGLAMAGVVYALGVRLFTGAWVPGWTALFIAVLFLGGVQLLSLGLFGEYVARIHSEVKRRPLYLVKERLGFPVPGHPVTLARRTDDTQA